MHIGFAARSLIYNTSGPGEPGFFLHIRALPRRGPLSARVTFPCGFATFDSPAEASEYLDHPGEVPMAARAYLKWLDR